MTKQETIIKAWMELDIKTPFGICDNTGFKITYCVNGIDDILSTYPNIEDKIEYKEDYDIIQWRPKSLNGIENNNGWIKIEGEDSLPKDFINCWIIFKNEPQIYIAFCNTHYFVCNGRFYDHEEVEYWQEIKTPNKPIYCYEK